MNDTKIDKKVLNSKVINKTAENGRVLESVEVAVIEYNGKKFIQLTKDKAGYGATAPKRQLITIDPKNEELKKAIAEAYKI